MIYLPTIWKPATCRLVTTSLRRCRRYSSTAQPEQVQVPCHSNGSITLDIYNPPKTSETSPSILLYLPPGPFNPNPPQSETFLRHLRHTLKHPVVQLNYRFSQTHRFPTPLHDVLAGYDWILENLLSKRSVIHPNRAVASGGVTVYGEAIGGGLATALALTECRTGQPGITAAAIRDPILDWVSLDDKPTSKSPSSSPNATTKTLLSLRKNLFTKPGHYFDPFASPLLFFRSPGVDIPVPINAPSDDLEHLSLLEREVLFSQSAALEKSELVGIPDSDRGSQGRKASRRFPSKHLGLRLPAFHIRSTQPAGSGLRAQAEELASQLRRSFIRQRKDAVGESRFGRKVLEEWEAEEMTDGQRGVLEAGVEDGRRKVVLDLGDHDTVEAEDAESVVAWLQQFEARQTTTTQSD